jgi:hypothetical protein
VKAVVTDVWEKVFAAADGSTDSPAALAERFDVPEDEVEERLSRMGLETCPGCGWWWMAMELDADNFCPDCVDP